MKNFILCAALISSFAAHAEVIKCGFTEPFVSFTYNTATEILVEKEAETNKKRIFKNVSFQIKYAGTFLLKDKSGKLLAELKLNNQGSDGMSDAIYPFDATYMNPMGRGQAIIGGCTSSLKPMVKESI
jgi:uncharacterized membrane protein